MVLIVSDMLRMSLRRVLKMTWWRLCLCFCLLLTWRIHTSRVNSLKFVLPYFIFPDWMMEGSAKQESCVLRSCITSPDLCRDILVDPLEMCWISIPSLWRISCLVSSRLTFVSLKSPSQTLIWKGKNQDRWDFFFSFFFLAGVELVRNWNYGIAYSVLW